MSFSCHLINTHISSGISCSGNLTIARSPSGEVIGFYCCPFYKPIVESPPPIDWGTPGYVPPPPPTISNEYIAYIPSFDATTYHEFIFVSDGTGGGRVFTSSVVPTQGTEVLPSIEVFHISIEAGGISYSTKDGKVLFTGVKSAMVGTFCCFIALSNDKLSCTVVSYNGEHATESKRVLGSAGYPLSRINIVNGNDSSIPEAYLLRGTITSISKKRLIAEGLLGSYCWVAGDPESRFVLEEFTEIHLHSATEATIEISHATISAENAYHEHEASEARFIENSYHEHFTQEVVLDVPPFAYGTLHIFTDFADIRIGTDQNVMPQSCIHCQYSSGIETSVPPLEVISTLHENFASSPDIRTSMNISIAYHRLLTQLISIATEGSVSVAGTTHEHYAGDDISLTSKVALRGIVGSVHYLVAREVEDITEKEVTVIGADDSYHSLRTYGPQFAGDPQIVPVVGSFHFHSADQVGMFPCIVDVFNTTHLLTTKTYMNVENTYHECGSDSLQTNNAYRWINV